MSLHERHTEERAQIHREDNDVRTEAEIGVIQLQAKKHQPLLADTIALERGKEEILHYSHRVSTLLCLFGLLVSRATRE